MNIAAQQKLSFCYVVYSGAQRAEIMTNKPTMKEVRQRFDFKEQRANVRPF